MYDWCSHLHFLKIRRQYSMPQEIPYLTINLLSTSFFLNRLHLPPPPPLGNLQLTSLLVSVRVRGRPTASAVPSKQHSFGRTSTGKQRTVTCMAFLYRL